MADLTADRLKQLLHYDPATGAFTRIAALNWRGELIPPRTSRAGTVDPDGYLKIGVGERGKSHKAHRLAWLYVFGEWPERVIDHINGDKLDNRIANLRACTQAQNCQNRRAAQSTSKTGVLGVTFDQHRGKFAAFIGVDGKSKNLGRFDTAEAASDAYLKAKRELHEFATI